MNIIVAGTLNHAQACMRWLKLDPDHWVAKAYGADLGTDVYESAKIVRPLGGIEQVHLDWILEKLVPAVVKRIAAIPEGWDLTAPEPVHQEEKRPSTASA